MIAEIATGAYPNGIAVHPMVLPAGLCLEWPGWLGDGHRRRRQSVIACIEVGKRPWNMAITRMSEVVCGQWPAGTISVIGAANLKLLGEIPVGELPWG